MLHEEHTLALEHVAFKALNYTNEWCMLWCCFVSHFRSWVLHILPYSESSILVFNGSFTPLVVLNGKPFLFHLLFIVWWKMELVLLKIKIKCMEIMGWMCRWPYPFLELNTPLAPLWYLGLALWHIPCYWIYSLIINSKFAILPRLFPRSFLRS